MHVVLDPSVALNVHGLALGIRAVDRAQVHVHSIQIVGNDGAHPLHNTVRLREFQILQRNFQRFHEIAQLDGVLALRVQKHLHVKLIVVMNGLSVCHMCHMRHLCGFFFNCVGQCMNQIVLHHNHIFHKIFQIVHGCVIRLIDALVLFSFIMLL